MNTPTATTTKQQRARKLSERGAASKEYQAGEDLGKRKRASKKDKENIDEAARAAEDEAMFQTKRGPAVIKKAAKPPQAAPMAKPAAPKLSARTPSTPKLPLAVPMAKPSGPKPSVPKPLLPAQMASAGVLSVPRGLTAGPPAAGAKMRRVPTAQAPAPAGKDDPPASDGQNHASTVDGDAANGDPANNPGVTAGEFAVPLPAGLAGPGGLQPKAPCAAAKHLAEDRQTLVGHG